MHAVSDFCNYANVLKKYRPYNSFMLRSMLSPCSVLPPRQLTNKALPILRRILRYIDNTPRCHTVMLQRYSLSSLESRSCCHNIS